MLAWIIILSVPISIVALIIWDAERLAKQTQSSDVGRGSPVAVISVVAALCSALSAVASFSVAQRSSELAEKSLVAANRPRVKVDIEVAGPIFYNVNGANFTLKYILKNIGHSPAFNVWVSPRLVAPIISPTNKVNFNPRAELQNDIAALKALPASPFGFSLFPDETIVQNVTVTMSQDEIKRATEILGAIYPRILGAVDYRMGFDDKAHQTGFIVEVRRNDVPRPSTIEKNRWPAAIWVDEGDVPAADVRLFRSFIDGGYAHAPSVGGTAWL